MLAQRRSVNKNIKQWNEVHSLILVTSISGRSKPEFCFLPRRLRWNALAQGALQGFTQWPWIEHPTFRLSTFCSTFAKFYGENKASVAVHAVHVKTQNTQKTNILI